MFKGPHFYDCQLSSSLIMRWPAGGVVENRRIDGLVELVDLAPTFLDAASLEIPERIQGKSMLPMIQGGAERLGCREQVYSEYYNSWTHGNAYGTMLRTRDEKIVVYHGTGEGEFCDLANDPEEFFNTLGSSRRLEKKKRNDLPAALMRRFSQWIPILLAWVLSRAFARRSV